MKILASFALISSLLIVSCTKPKDLEYVDIQNVRLLKMGLKEAEVGIDLRFFNPNRQRVQMKDAQVDVFINDQFIGKSTLDSTVDIPKRDTFLVPVKLKVETLATASNLIQSIGDSAVLIRLDGKAKLGKSGIFFNYPVKYETRQKLSELNF